MELWKPEPTEIFKKAFIQAHQNLDFGLCLEFGVGQGHSFCWQAKHMMDWAINSHLIGFDSFEGLPAETPGVWAPERHGKGCFWYPRDVLKQHLEICGIPLEDPRFEIIEGLFEHSLTRDLQHKLMQEKLIFVNIDVDIHLSTIQALDFVKPMMRPGLVIYFDDYRDPRDETNPAGAKEWGENLAWRQWSAKNNINAVLGETNELNQRYYVVAE